MAMLQGPALGRGLARPGRGPGASAGAPACPPLPPALLGPPRSHAAAKPRAPPGRPWGRKRSSSWRRGGHLVASRAATGEAGSAESQEIVFVDEEDRYYYRTVRSSDYDTPAPANLYELLGVEMETSDEDLKAAFRKMQKLVHPDIGGEECTAASILLNAAYTTLSTPKLRALYDDELVQFQAEQGGSFTGKPRSEWQGQDGEQRALFIDETACIGCGHCVMAAPETFEIEDTYGRALCHTQWGNEEWMVKEAVEMCPVDCIHFVRRRQLALLEWCVQQCEREDIAIVRRRLSGNMASAGSNKSPFTQAELFMKRREEARVTREFADARGAPRAHDADLAAAISKAWLSLPQGVKVAGWPSWMEDNWSEV